MATIRINKTKDYTVMSNYHFKEKEMSLKAKGLLSLMLSLPDEWNYSINGLVTLSKDGKDSVMKALNELEQFGYLIRTKCINEKGQFDGYDYDIYEKPNTEKPYTENPNTGKPHTGNPTQLNINNKELNNEELNNKYNIIVDYLNLKANTRYKASSKNTQSYIKARLNEGFSVDDFKTVIDKKVKEWKRTQFEKFLRPETLFGSKFENYLNSPARVYAGNKMVDFANQRDYTEEELASLIDDIDDIKF